MPTFKAVCLKHQVKSDNTVRIKIRVTHQRESKYIDARLTATTNDLTKAFKLKTEAFISDTNKTIAGYRDKCNKEPYKVNEMTCEQLINFLTTKEKTAEDLDFISYAREEIEKLKVEGRHGVAGTRITAINTLERFVGSNHLPVSAITFRFLTDFERFIVKNPVRSNKGMIRGPALYMSEIRALHNKMKLEFNDEDEGVILVPLSPFTKYKLPQPKPTRKRAIGAELIKKIFELSNQNTGTEQRGGRYALALDCFVLSFCLIGMNSTDLFSCPPVKKGNITYKRMKTRTRRKDEAEISIDIQPEVKSLMKKYKDPSGQRAFNFYKNYADSKGLNKSINIGLKEVGKIINVEDLEYYAARHSWATIALNKVKIDKYTVHSALNHVDEAMKVTDIYLDKDWSLINDANRKVLDYIQNIPSLGAV